ncbi:MAG TPA: CPBP family glutamic-type intramembrane protease [Planctomycetota bacterium]
MTLPVMLQAATTVRRATWELLAVLGSAALHFVTTLCCDLQAVDQIVLGSGWLGYVLWRARTPGVLAGWGLQRAGLRACSRAASLAFVTGAIACAAIGVARHTFVLDWHLLPLLLVYPLWGLVQQLLVLGIVVGNLERFGMGRFPLALTAGLGFAVVHAPDWPLCGATLVLGVACCTLFLRHRCLWPLGVLHGWLGAVFYRWVLARDPWAEFLSAFA